MGWILMNRIGDSLFHVESNKQLILSFVDIGVEFIVIGGLAVAWYCEERQADDMDLLVSASVENSLKISQALSSLNMHDYQEDSFAKLGLQVVIKKRFYAELLTPLKIGPTYAEIAVDAIDAKLFGIPVRLASASCLIKLKKLAVIADDSQKDKHLKDIKCLESFVERDV
ncbi:hypothetical protein [Undibacterium terreum]|nr:hypothetical protein [Undibacterium terreum]